MLVHDGRLVHWDDSFGCRWAVTQGAVWPDRVVMTAPVFDEYLSLAQRVEDLAIKEFIPNSWHFSSASGHEWRLRIGGFGKVSAKAANKRAKTMLINQFGAFDIAAEILAEKTQQLAS